MDKRRGAYRQLTAWAMQLLKDGCDEAHIIAELLRTLPGYRPQKCRQPVSPPSSGGLLVHPKGQFYFITSLQQRQALSVLHDLRIINLPIRRQRHHRQVFDLYGRWMNL